MGKSKIISQSSEIQKVRRKMKNLDHFRFFYPKFMKSEFFKAKNFADRHPNKKLNVDLIVTDVKLALSFLTDGTSTKVVTIEQFTKKIRVFHPKISQKEIEFLFDGKKELTKRKLKAVLMNPLLKFYKPVKQSFKLFDSQGKAFVDEKVVKMFFEKMGYTISEGDLDAMIEMAGTDDDTQKLSYPEYKNMNNMD